MKRKSLLFLLLMALFAPWAANAQTTVEIGDGTSTDYYTPIGTYYNYSITEQLYTAEEIGMAGTISSISFNYASSTAKDFPITVYMMHTDAENLSTGISLADADVVFEGTYSVTGTGWMTITLDSPFAYDGTSNLLIGINKGYVYYYSGNTWYHTTTNAVMARYTQQDGSAYTTSTIPGTTRTARPNIRMEITPGSGPSCAKPNGLAVEINALNAVFTWNSEATSFDIAHSMDATADPNNCIVGHPTTNSYEFANLALGDHYVWVRANCGNNDYSDWSAKKSFHIGYCVPAPSSVDNNGISNVTFGMGDYVVNNDTPKATYADYSNLVGAVQEGVESTIAITFQTGYTYNTYVWVDLDNSLSFDADEVVCYGESTSSNPTTLTLSFVIPTTQALGDYALRIGSADSGLGSDPTAADPCYTGTYGCFQDYTLRVLEAPSCLTPTGLAVSNVTGHAATISWTSDAEAWQIQLGENAAIDVTETTYTFTGLAPETTFSVKVRTDCGGTYSEWSNPVSFTTAVACPVPTAVTITDITPYTAVVNCTSGAENFNVMLNNDTVLVGENVTMPFALIDLEPNTSYTVKVQAICGGIDGESAWTTGTSFLTAEVCPDGMVCIGSGSATNVNLPLHNYYKYSLTEQIYTTAELGAAGAIESIDFYKAATIETVKTIDIYMVSTTKSEFTGNTDWINVTAADLVFSGTVTFADNDWTTIVLDNPFIYDGLSNVALVVDNNTGNYKSNTAFLTFSTGATYQAIYYSSDNQNPDPTNVTQSGTRTYSKNRIRLAVGEPPACLKPTGLEVTTDGATAIATWEGTATSYNIMIDTVLVENVTSPYEFDVELDTEYTVKVQANCGSDLSEWTNPVTFTTPECIGGHTIEYTLTDSYGDGWNGASITLVDGECTILETLTVESGRTATGTLELCGDYYQFVWNQGSYDSECSFTFTEGGTTLFTKPSTVTDGLVLYTIDNTPAPRPSDIAVDTTGLCYATLSWTENGTATAWEILLNGETTIQADANPFTIDNLNAGTEYTVKLRSVTTDGNSLWTCPEFSFTTEEGECYAPTDLTAHVMDYNADTIMWEGTNASYNLRYRTAATYEGGFSDGFEMGMEGWTVIDADGDGYTWEHSSAPDSYFPSNVALNATGHDNSQFFAISGSFSNVYGVLTPDNYLVTPQVELGHTLTFWACAQDANYAAEHFGVAVSTTGNTDPADFTMVQEWTMSAKGMGAKANPGTTRSGNRGQGTWYQFTVDLSAYSGMGYIAIRHFNCSDQFLLNLDDFAYGVQTNPAGDWTTINDITNNYYVLEGLDESTRYEVQVQGVCQDATCGAVTTSWVGYFFTTLAQEEPIAVLDGGEWTDPDTWINTNAGQVPESTQSVAIAGEVIIPASTNPEEPTVITIQNVTITEGSSLTVGEGSVLDAQDIIVAEGGELIIEEGAEVMHTNEVPVAMSMNIATSSTSKDGKSGYHLIASPIAPSVAAANTGLIRSDDNYDLYYFDQEADADGNEWINYKANTFSQLFIKKGYLYSNNGTDNNMIIFSGQTLPTSGVDVYQALAYTSAAEFAGWNLLGNPYTCSTRIYSDPACSTEMGHYTLNADGSEVIASPVTQLIAPMEGFFVVATGEGQACYFSTTNNAKGGSALEMNVNVNRGNVIDRAILRFDNASRMPKVQLNENHTKIYMPVEGTDYAVVDAMSQGEMPVSFKAENSGTYTINFGIQNVEFSYLHLVDNMTGTDVNLLETPSYSFDASTTDYANRFKLVFATGSSVDSDSFGFINGMGNLCIFGIEGEATVQVIDVLGHVLSSDTFSGSYEKSINAAPGVYMIRLINGNDVKVQKIVVR